MAQGSDGSIVIDTELDNADFDKGAKDLDGKIDALVGKINGINGDVSKAVGKALPLLQSIASSAQGIYAAMTSGANQAADAGERMTATQRGMGESANTAAQAFRQEGMAISSMTGTAKSSLSGLEREVNTLSANVAGISKSAEMGFANGKAVLAFDSKITAAEQKLVDAKAKLEAFGQVQIPTQEFTEIQNQIDASTTKLDALKERMDKFLETGGSRKSSAFTRMQYDAAQLENTIEYAKGEIEELKASGGAFTLGSDTSQYQAMQAALKQTEAELARNKALIDSEAIAQARLNVQVAQEKVAVAQTGEQRKAALAQLQQAQAELANVAAQSSNQTAPSSESTTGWKNFEGIMKRVGKAAVSTAGMLARVSFKAIASGAKKAVSALKSFITQSNKTSSCTKALVRQLTSLKTMLLTRIKSAFISSVTSAVTSGIESLASYSAAFNSSMSNIKNSCTQLGGNIAVAFSNLVNAVSPAITSLINMISEAISYINAFFALLSGKSSVTVAKKATASYADATQDAASAQAELNRQVYGFDELNKRNKESDSSSGSSSGSTVEYEDVPIDSLLPDSVQDWFQKIKDAFEAGDWYGIGQIIADGLNTAMGKVDDWINDTLRPLGVTWASRIAQILNGLVDGFDWSLLGKTIADGLNAAFDIANTFLTTFNFENLGSGVGNAINSAFTNIDWALVGQTLANGINAAVGFLHGIVTTVDFLSVGSDLATALNNAVATTDFTLIGETFGAGVRGAIQAAFGFVEGIDFDALSEKLKQAGQAFIDQMNAIDPSTGLNGWQELGVTLADAADGIIQAVESLPWGEIASGVGETISTFLSDSGIEIKLILAALTINGISKVLFGEGILSLIATNLGTSILSKLGTVWPSLSGAVSSALGGLGSALGGAASSVGSLAAGAAEIGGAILAGLFIGGEIGKLIDNYIIGPAIEALGGDQVTAELYKNFHWFGEGGFFDEMWDNSSSFSENVSVWLDALGMMFSDAWDAIKTGASTAWDGITGALSSAWSGIKTGASTAWNGIKTTVSTAFTNAKTALSTTASNIKSNVSTAWSNIKSNTSTAWNNVKTGITTAFTNAKSSISTTASNIKSSMSTTWSNVKSNATQTWNNIKSSVSGTFTNLKSSLSGTANNIKSTVSGAWTSIKSTATSKWTEIKNTVSTKWSGLKTTLSATDWTSIGSNLVSGLKSGISNAWSTLTTSVGNLCSSLTKKVKSVFGINSPSKVFAEIGGYLDEGMEQGIENNEAQLLSTASNLADAVTDGLTPASPEIDVSADSTVTSITAVADRLSGIASTFSTIAQILSNMGGLVVPQVAAGTVVPYKTKIDTTGSTADVTASLDTEAIDKFADGVDERFVDLTYKIQQLIDLVAKKNLNIDIDALTQAITKQQRTRELNYGGV